MQDIALNRDFSVQLDDSNDLDQVTGREAFEQGVVVRLTDLMTEELPGLTRRSSIEERISLMINRVAQETDYIDEIQSIEIAPKFDAPNTYQVRVIYTSDEIFEREVSF